MNYYIKNESKYRAGRHLPLQDITHYYAGSLSIKGFGGACWELNKDKAQMFTRADACILAKRMQMQSKSDVITVTC